MAEETVIGTDALLRETPTVLTVDGDRYVLSTGPDGDPVLFSAVCPHQRGRVSVVDDGTLRCPNHRWEFDAETGACVSRGDEPLDAYPVRVVDGDLLAPVG